MKADYSLAQAGAKGEGLLIGSFTTDSKFPDTYAERFVETRVFINDKENEEARSPIYSKTYLDVKSGCNLDKPGESDFKDVCGYLFATSLPAGSYYITGWDYRVTVNGFVSYNFRPVSFTIQAGKATYIGNIHVLEFRGTNPRNGIYILEGVSVINRDEQARDIPLLEAKYPGITADLIDYQIRPFQQ